MPPGLLQMVDETGWQLPPSECNQFSIACTLLHGADCLILDERFATLDPETLHQALPCVLERAPTLLVIAHPGGACGPPLTSSGIMPHMWG